MEHVTHITIVPLLSGIPVDFSTVVKAESNTEPTPLPNPSMQPVTHMICYANTHSILPKTHRGCDGAKQVPVYKRQQRIMRC